MLFQRSLKSFDCLIILWYFLEHFLGSIFLAILLKIAPVYKPARWISIMRSHWKMLLIASPFLKDVLISELKNSKTFFTLWFARQDEDIVLTNFFTSSLHLCRNIFTCTNFHKCRSLDISRGFIFANKGHFTSKYNKKSGTIFWFCISRVICFCEKPKNLWNSEIWYTRKCWLEKKGSEQVSSLKATLHPHPC